MVERLTRRRFVQGLGWVGGAVALGIGCTSRSRPDGTAATTTAASTPVGWPAPDAWDALNERVGGRLVRPVSPVAACLQDAGSDACAVQLGHLENPFFVEDQPGATQSTGWLDAWERAVSPYAVAAETVDDIAAAVDFAREHDVRIAVKGTGHDYLGRSNAPDSLLVWTHRMRNVTVHDAFVPAGAPAGTPGRPALSVGAGTRWLEAYGAATHAGLYVQGGGCTSVGASGGFIQGGGYGSFSKRFGTGAGGVLEFEVVTADGRIRIVNATQDPDLFWALRGGGGATFGVVSRTTLLAHPIPARVGTVAGTITASDDVAYRALLDRLVAFYPDALDNEHWGEQIDVRPDNTLGLALTFLELSETEATAVWAPFLDPLRADSRYRVDVTVHGFAFEHLWDLAWWEAQDPDFVTVDPRPQQPANQYWWASNGGEVSAFWNSYQSRWVPLTHFTERPADLTDALYRASRIQHLTLHINKGLSGEAPEARARDRETSIHPGVFDAAALIILGSSQARTFPGVAGHEPDLEAGRAARDQVDRAMAILRDALPGQGAYLNEADYFTEDWPEEFWGSNYPRLLEVKRRVDPDNLFRVHHGVGSD